MVLPWMEKSSEYVVGSTTVGPGAASSRRMKRARTPPSTKKPSVVTK